MEFATGSVTECQRGQFQCQHSGTCIAAQLVCDGHYQCGGDDTSDELSCVNSKCPFLHHCVIIYGQLLITSKLSYKIPPYGCTY